MHTSVGHVSLRNSLMLGNTKRLKIQSTHFYWASLKVRFIGYVLWHINSCRLFNAVFCLYIYILNGKENSFVILGEMCFMAYQPL